MTDIVERLRQYEGELWETTACYNGTRDEAADEIERERNLKEHYWEGLQNQAARADKAEAEIERLREAIRRYVDGDWMPPVAKPYRTDGKWSKMDQCPHGRYMYEDCSACVDEYFSAVLHSESTAPEQKSGQ